MGIGEEQPGGCKLMLTRGKLADWASSGLDHGGSEHRVHPVLLGRKAAIENGKLPVGLHCNNIDVVVVVDLRHLSKRVGVVKIGLGRLGDVGAVYICVDWVSNAFRRGRQPLRQG